MQKIFDTSLFERCERERSLKKEEIRIERLKEAKYLLKEYFQNMPVTRVYLTGSIIQKNRFFRHSDIDIAVEGLDGKEYFRVFGDVEEILQTEHIDLIEIERCHFRDYIEKYGERII